MTSSSFLVGSRFETLLAGVRSGDTHAAQEFWGRYWPRLLRLADRRSPQYNRRTWDEEDVALSALRTFMRRASLGEYEGLRDEPALWKLLCVILARKITRTVRHENAKKRGASSQVSLSHDPVDAKSPVDDHVLFAETLFHLMHVAGPDVAPFIQMRLEGYRLEEIAEAMGCSTRSVERRLDEARNAWIQIEDAE